VLDSNVFYLGATMSRGKDHWLRPNDRLPIAFVQMGLEEFDENVIGFLGFREIFLREEAVPHAVPQMQLSNRTRFCQLSLSFDSGTHVPRTRAGEE
jgi:hypothetical protein